MFHLTWVEFLRFIVAAGGVSIDKAKSSPIITWITPKNLKKYNPFSYSLTSTVTLLCFSDIVIPLTQLTQKDTPFEWGDTQQKVFAKLKESFSTAPVHIHFDLNNPIVVETDASDYAITAILSQISPEDDDIHPIALYLHRMQPAELNYKIYDK